MDVYRRYFEIKDAATLARINEILTSRRAHKAAIVALRDRLGAVSVYWNDQGQIAAFEFEQKPDLSAWKEVGGNYMPRLNTKAGKAIQAMIDELGDPPGAIHDALRVAGLSVGLCLVGNGKGYRPSICGFEGEAARWFAVVPWYDEQPETLERYKEERAAGTRMSCNLDHLLWTPPAEWVQLKEWEVKKAIDDAKEAA